MSKLLKQLALSSFVLLCAAFSTAAMAGDTLQRVVDFKVLKVGMSATQPPMNVVNREGKLMGYDVDLAALMARALQVKLEIKVLPFGDLMGALHRNEIDMVMSGMAITPERAEQASFVGPYMMSGKSILTKDSVLAKAASSEEFNRADLKLVALKNSTSASFVSRAAPEATLIEVANYDAGVAMIIEGTADGMVADMPACVLSVLRYPNAGLVTMERPVTIEPIGIAVNKNDPEFHNLVDNYLDAYGKMGLLTKLRKKWFEDKTWIAALP